MISLYSGTPGSGKSLHCARTIINWSRLGYPVIGNFTVDLSKYKRAAYTYCPNDQMTPKFLIDYSRQRFGDKAPKEGSILLVIDECQLLFNAREWQHSGRAQWLSFFTQHRKLGYDIILIAQFDRMIDRQIRSLIEYEYIHRKMSNFGWQGKALSLFFGGKTFIAVKMWYPLHERLGSELFHARKSLYSIYDSYATFDDGQQTAPKPAAAAPAQEENVPPSPAPAPAAPERKRRSIAEKIAARKAAASPDPEVKVAEIVDPKPRKKPKQPGILAGSYLRPWAEGSMVSRNGKYLHPGGRSETGWKHSQVNSSS